MNQSTLWVILALGFTTAPADRSWEQPRPKTKPAAAPGQLQIGGIRG